MRITKVKLENYVCFYDTPEFELGPGINFVVGKNNAGKTALLDVLSHSGNGEAHRSVFTLPRYDSDYRSQSQTKYQVHYLLDVERTLALQAYEEELVYLPYSRIGKEKPAYISIQALFDWFEGDQKEITYRFEANDAIWAVPEQLAVRIPLSTESMWKCIPAEVYQTEGSFRLGIVDTGDSATDDTQIKQGRETCWAQFAKLLPRYAYRFLPERPVLSTGTQASSSVLQSDSSNLPQVMRTLQGSDDFLWKKFVNEFCTLFPEVHNIRLEPEESGDATIVLDFLDSSERRPDLGVPLEKCGTGFGQVLAMLYVVITSEEPRVILIDEPNSFLHPGAVRKLLEIFQQYDQHQYIIATHSPTAIMSVKKKRILLVEREDMRSTVKSVNVNDNADLERALKSIGSRRSDIFGMDAVIWVEGKTDEMCFKLIMEANGGLPDGVKIQALVNTGDLEDKKHATLALQIYHKMSGGIGIQPTALGFLFDGDKDGAHEKAQGDGFAKFRYLPRQNFESYLIDPASIAEVLQRDVAEDKQEHCVESVKKWIRDRYDGVECDDLEWLKQVHGADLLDNLFKDLGGISYKDYKAAYGEELTKRILRKHHDHFSDIVNLIKRMIE